MTPSVAEVEATFDAPKPCVIPTATPENVVNTYPRGTGYVTLATGNNGINMYKCSYINPKTNQPETGGVISYMCVPTNAPTDLRQEPGIRFNAYPPDGPTSFRYAWVQVLNVFSVKETLVRNNRVPVATEQYGIAAGKKESSTIHSHTM